MAQRPSLDPPTLCICMLVVLLGIRPLVISDLIYPCVTAIDLVALVDMRKENDTFW